MDYRAEISRLQSLIAEQEQELVNRSMKIWQQIVSNPDNFEWNVTDGGIIETSIFTRYAGRPYVVIRKRLKPDVWDTWSEWYAHVGIAKQYMDGQWQDMKYILTDEGILTHEGGSTLVLNDPKLCSEAEWYDLCIGNVPAKFIR